MRAAVGARHLSPLPGACASCGYRCLRRDVGGPIHRPRGNGRRPEGERNGSRSGRPGGNRFRRSLSNEAEPATALAAQGAMAHARQRSAGAGSQSCAPGHKSPPRVPKGNPGTVRSQGALQQGSQGDLPESPGASSPPGCRVGTRVPVAPPAPRRRRTARGLVAVGCNRVSAYCTDARCNGAMRLPPIAPYVHSPRLARSLAQYSSRFLISASKPRPAGS